jgi:diaminohydroxyphosphoribosylaminopyrimidine deaminase / 5-amino-6-(5-phosphoribosylamino)uracil reductase
MLPVRPAPFIEAAADQRYMKAAIGLSRRGLGLTYPNPSVSALVVRFDGHRQWIVGRGVTAPGGRPHAERIALQQAGEAANGATLYVRWSLATGIAEPGLAPPAPIRSLRQASAGWWFPRLIPVPLPMGAA